nr:reverse transcriptase domain-containing protein [Tanacetum cinerariifolium]
MNYDPKGKRNLFLPLDNPELKIQRRSHADPTLLNEFEMADEENGDLPVPDLRTMEELCQPSLNDWVQNSCQFHGLSGDDANKHLDKFLHVTQNIKVNGVSDDALRLWNLYEKASRKIAALNVEMAEINKNLMRVQPPLAKPRMYMLREATKVVILTNLKGASHGPNPPPAYRAPAYQTSGYQASVHQPSIPQLQVVTTNEFTKYMKANDAILKNMQTNMTSLTNSNLEHKSMFGQFMKMNTVLSSGSGTLPSNTITNPKEDLKGITTRSGTAYQGPMIPTTSSSLPQVVECETEVTKDTVPPTNNGSTKDVQPLVVQVETPILNSEPVVAPIIEPVVAPVNALILMPKFGPTIKSLLTNKDKLSELAKTPLNEHCSAVPLKKLPEKLGEPGKFLIPCDFSGMDECLALANLGTSINLMPLSMWNKLSLPELSTMCMTLKLADCLISRPVGVAKDVFVKIERALIDVFEGELTLCVNKEAITFNLDQTSRYSANYNDMTANRIDVIDMASKNDKSSIDEPPEVELKDLPPHLEYAFLEGDDKLPIIIAIDLSDEEKTALVKVLKSHKRAITWKLSDIKGINPEFYTHKILMKEDFKPMVQHKRRVDLKIHDVIKKEVKKLLDAGLIYPISNSPWVSPVHCVPKKVGFTVVENEENELILTRLVTGWRVYIDYQKLNEATRKDHFPLSFMD